MTTIMGKLESFMSKLVDHQEATKLGAGQYGDKMARRIVDITDDAEEEDLAQFVPLARAPTDEEIHHIYPKRVFGGGRDAAQAAATKILRLMSPSLKHLLVYNFKKGEYPGYAAMDLLDQCGPDLITFLKELDYSKCKWLKLYLLNMGAALQLLGTFVQGERPAIRDLDDNLKQRIMMAMDILSGVLAYAISFLTGEYDEAVRRGFLMTGGRRFVSVERVQMAEARADHVLCAPRVQPVQGW